MNVEVGKDAGQNSALLTFLAGTWTTNVAAHVRNDLGVATGIRVDTRFTSGTVRGHFKPLPDGGVAGHYMLFENPAGDDESTADCFLRLKLDRTDNTLVAYLRNDKSAPAIKGIWSNSGFHFLGDFHDGILMWDVFRAIWLQVTARPSIVSIIVRQASESSWLLDVAFVVEQSFPSQDTPARLRCRLEFWHFREGPGSSVPPHLQDVEESFDEVLRRCNDVRQDIDSRIGEIDNLIASLEDSRTKCEEGLRLLREVKSNALSGKDEVESLGDDLQEAILELHENPLIPGGGSVVAGEEKRTIARTWVELNGLRTDAESLDSAIDSIEADVYLPDDLIGSAWTNAEYARGLQLLRENRDHLPAPDLSFLGPFKASVSKLSKAATGIVNKTAVLVQLALEGLPLDEMDHGPEIAGMAKACERILDDVFMEKREAIARDPAVAALISDERNWQYRIPASMFKMTAGDLTNVVKMVKKSIETNTAIRWNGMGNKRIALLLFGGWIPVCQGSREHVLNPLGVKGSEEYVQTLPDRLSEFQTLRNGFVHHDLADKNDLRRTWECFHNCLKGLLQAFYSGSE
ncbi:MAG: hypothetical protein ACJ8F7_20105 [Gemmataceae bacterium]